MRKVVWAVIALVFTVSCQRNMPSEGYYYGYHMHDSFLLEYHVYELNGDSFHLINDRYQPDYSVQLTQKEKGNIYNLTIDGKIVPKVHLSHYFKDSIERLDFIDSVGVTRRVLRKSPFEDFLSDYFAQPISLPSGVGDTVILTNQSTIIRLFREDTALLVDYNDSIMHIRFLHEELLSEKKEWPWGLINYEIDFVVADSETPYSDIIRFKKSLRMAGVRRVRFLMSPIDYNRTHSVRMTLHYPSFQNMDYVYRNWNVDERVVPPPPPPEIGMLKWAKRDSVYIVSCVNNEFYIDQAPVDIEQLFEFFEKTALKDDGFWLATYFDKSTSLQEFIDVMSSYYYAYNKARNEYALEKYGVKLESDYITKEQYREVARKFPIRRIEINKEDYELYK